MKRVKRTSTFVLLAVAGVLATSCGGPEKKVVARVGDRKITVGDVVIQYRTMSVNVRPFVETLEGKRNFLNDIINKEILLAEAQKRGLDKSPDLQKAVSQVEGGLLAEKYFTVNVREKVKVTDEQLRELYDRMGEQVHLRLVFLASEAEARNVESLLQGGTDFATVARQHSADARSAERGGDMGMKPWAEYPPELIAALRPLQTGQLSPIVASRGGFVIARIESRQANPLQDFESEKANLRERMRTAEENRLASEWQAARRAEIQLVADSTAVNAVLAAMRKAQGQRLQFQGQAAYVIPPEDQALPLATFAGRTWTVRDYLERLAGIAPERRPSLKVTAPQLVAFIADLAVREVAIEDARKQGYADDPEIRAAVERQRERHLVNLLHVELSNVRPDSIPMEDVRRYYDEHQASLIAPAQARILPAVFATEAEARDALKQVRTEGVTLRQVADEKSLDRAAAAMGEEGIPILRTPDPTPLERLVFMTEPKRLAGPVQTDNGWTVFRVIDKSGESQMTFEQAEPQIRMQLAEEMTHQRFDEWLATEREKRQIKIDEKALASIDFGTKARPDLEGGESPQGGPTPVGASAGGS